LPVLPRDGRNLVYLGQSLYYRNLDMGEEREINARIPAASAAFRPDATKIIFQGAISADDQVDSGVYKVPVSAGVPKKFWEEPGMFQGISDWSPDGDTVFFGAVIPGKS
jgi:dipeptidyl aminopeptidase/acylaminoacyl peptidase